MNTRQLPSLVRPLENLDRQELIDALADVFEALYLDCDAAGRFVWNPDREWDVCTIDDVAGVLRSHGSAIRPAAGASEAGRALWGPKLLASRTQVLLTRSSRARQPRTGRDSIKAASGAGPSVMTKLRRPLVHPGHALLGDFSWRARRCFVPIRTVSVRRNAFVMRLPRARPRDALAG